MGLEKLAESLAKEIGLIQESAAYLFSRLVDLKLEAESLMFSAEFEQAKEMKVVNNSYTAIKRKPGRPKKKRGPGRPRKVEA